MTDHPTRVSLLLSTSLFLANFTVTSCSSKLVESGEATEKPAPMQALGPGGGGSTFIPTFHPENPRRILLRCDMGGAYLTEDQGQSWKMLNFKGGARTFAFDPTDEGTIYVGAAALHATRDGGRTWNQLFPDPKSVTAVRHVGDHASPWLETTDQYPKGPGASVSSILVDPRDPGHLLVGVNGRGENGRISRLFRSRDGGAQWTTVADLDRPVLKMLVSPGSSGTILVFSTSSRLVLSAHGDALVQAARDLPEEVVPLQSLDGGIDPESGLLTLWAVGGGPFETAEGGRLFRSRDEGVYWEAMVPQLLADREGADTPSFSGVGTAREDSRVAYATCNRWIERNANGELGHWYGVLKTVDAGKTWSWAYRAGGGSSDYTIRDGMEAENVDDGWVEDAFSGEYIRMLDVGVYARDPDTALFTDWYRSLLTTDGGTSWTALYSQNLPDGTVQSRGLDVTTSYGVHFDPFDPNHLAVSYTDIGFFHSHDRGRSWKRSVDGVPPAWDNTCYWLQFDPEVKDRIWSVWSSWHDIPRMKMIRRPDWSNLAVGGVCRSDDGGKSWSVTSRGLPEAAPSTSLVLDPSSPQEGRTLYVAVYGKGVYRSGDGGESWEARNEGLSENLNAWEMTLATDGSLFLIVSHNTRFDEGRVRPDLMPGELYRSRNGADSWERISLPEGVRYPNSLSVHPGQPDRLLLACWAGISPGDFGGPGGEVEGRSVYGGVWSTEDGGSTWRSLFDPSAYVYGVTIDPAQPSRVFVNTFQGAAYYSVDDGRNWQALDGYDFGWGHRVIPDPLDPEMVFLTTFGGSLFHGAVRPAP